MILTVVDLPEWHSQTPDFLGIDSEIVEMDGELFSGYDCAQSRSAWPFLVRAHPVSHVNGDTHSLHDDLL